MARATHLELIGNQFKVYYDDTRTATAYPTQGSIWLVGETSGDGEPGEVDGDYAYPYGLDYISDEFGLREDVGRWHEGTDFAGGPASYGNPIPAIAAGTVELAEYYGAFGNATIVNHGTIVGGTLDGYTLKTLSAHQISLGPAHAGDTVTLGQTLGYVNNSGSSFGSHLHLEVHAIPPGGSMTNDYLNPNPAPPSNRTAIDIRDFMSEYNPTGVVIYP